MVGVPLRGTFPPRPGKGKVAIARPLCSVYTLEVPYCTSMCIQNRVPNNTQFLHAVHTGHHVYNSDGIFRLHFDFQFEFIM